MSCENNHRLFFLRYSSSQGMNNTHWSEKGYILRTYNLRSSHSGCWTYRSETQNAINLFFFHQLGNTSTTVPCGQKRCGFGSVLQAVRPSLLSCQEDLSALPQFCLINQLARPVGFPASRLPCQIAQEKEQKISLSLHSFSLCYHLSIRSLFCAQLRNVTECLSFSS